MNTAQQKADYIVGLYVHYGDADYIGEPVSQLEHMCQCAMLAEKEGYDEEVILAAFFHDIGHLCEHIIEVGHMDEYGVIDHEKLGADFLRDQGFSEKIASLVQNHVQAKRYLTYADTTYYEQLSEASKKTLEFQGGRMNEEEAAAFEQDPFFEQHVRLRRWDDMAKLAKQPLPSLQKFNDLILRHLKNNTNAVEASHI